MLDFVPTPDLVEDFNIAWVDSTNVLESSMYSKIDLSLLEGYNIILSAH